MSAKNQQAKRSTKHVGENEAKWLIVGVGASTGDFDAVKEFLSTLEKHRDVAANLSIVLVQHVNPGNESLLPQLAKQATSMKVVPIKKSAKLNTGAIYVAPPNALVEAKNGVVKVVHDVSDPPSTTIDDFLHSLAEDQAAHAVGVILSGVGSDGALGLKAISDAGGLTFSQTFDSATGDSMPHSAARSRVADHVLSPTEIAEELTKYAASSEGHISPSKTLPPTAAVDSMEHDLLRVMQRILQDEFSSKSVVVDDEGQIVCASSDMQKYLTVGTGKFQNNIIKMARNGIRVGLRATLQTAKSERRRVVHDDLSVKVDGNLQRVKVTVQPMPQIGEEAELFMVIFHDSGLPLSQKMSTPVSDATVLAATSSAAGVPPLANEGGRSNSIIAHLERELASTRDDLERSFRSVEATNRELRASNEELLSLNEELQTTNEELATSKEEIEASALAQEQAKDDLGNLLHSTQIATIFLDDELKIHSFTEAAKEIYGLIESDVGRPLSQLLPRSDNVPPLRQVSDESKTEDTFKTHDGKWFSRRVTPYQNQKGESHGIVVTFVDVTNERNAQRKVAERERQLKTLTDNTPAMIAYIDAQQRYQFANESFATQFKMTTQQLVGSTVLEVLGETNYIDVEEHLEAALFGERRVFEMELTLDYLPEPLIKEVTYVPDTDADGLISGCYVMVVDITQRKQWEQVLQDRESYLRKVIDNIGGFVGILDVDGILKDVNKIATFAGGLSRKEVVGKPFWECYWWSHDEQIADQLRDGIKTAASGEQVRYDVAIRMANNTRMMIDFTIAPVFDDEGKVIALIPSGVDISERVVAQEQAIRRQQQLNLATEVGRLGSWTWDIPSNSISWSDQLHTLYGYNRDEFDGTSEAVLEIVIPDDRHIVETAIEEVLNQGVEMIEYECRSIRKLDGRQIWTQIRGVTERDVGGKAVRATGFAVDITARKQRELSLAFLAGLQVELTDLSTVKEIVSLATKRTVEFLELTHCVLIETDENVESADILHDHHIEGAPDLRGLYTTSNFWNDEDKAALAGGELLAINDTDDPARPKRYSSSFGALGIRAIVNAPCMRNQRAIFILCALKSTAYQWQPHEKELLRELAASLHLRIERARAETELIASKEQLQLGIEVANLAMGHVDYVSNQIALSAEAAQLYGLGDEPVVVARDKIHSMFHPDDREKLGVCIADSLNPNGDGRICVEHRIVGSEGATGWLNVRKQVFFDRSVDPPRPSHATLVAQDITQRKESESSLKEARAMAELASKSKSEFLANMSHEIRTPMSAILGYADILNRHLKDPDNRNCVSIIRSNGQFLLGIINDILDISKIEAGKLELCRSHFHVDQLVTDVMSLMSVRATEKKIDLTVRYTGNIPQSIRSDEKRIKQVLVNLVGNAIKFTEKGVVTLSIGLEKKPFGSLLRFDVIDTGIGVSTDQAQKLFQPFTQADNSVDRKFGGTGLGLTISQRLARMLEGDITFESELGKGSTFTLTIDVGDLDNEKLVNPELSTPQAVTLSQPKTTKAGSRLDGRFLVVDDRREIRFIAQHFIEDAGGQVVTAENGQQAIDIVTAGAASNTIYNAVVMDMQMPVMDGYEAARCLRTIGFEQPIIALTAHAMDGDRDRCIEAGCTNYISKPLDGPEFVDLLASYLNETIQKASVKKILVVDDSHEACSAVATVLRLEGHEVQKAYDGRSAIESANQFQPDVVLLDLGLPDMSGFDVLKTMKHQSALKDTHFIALTGRQDNGDTKEAGFDHHFLKPLDVTELDRYLRSG